jgi:hypothetical protein
VTTTGPASAAAVAPGGGQRGEQAVDADRDAGRGHGLAGEAPHEVVVAAAAGHRAELARAALVVEDLEGELGLVDGAGVVAEAADDGGVEHDAVGLVAARRGGPRSARARRRRRARSRSPDELAQAVEGGGGVVAAGGGEGEDDPGLPPRGAPRPP